MYLDLWKVLRNQSSMVHNPAELRSLMDRLEQKALDEAKFERHPHKALRHLRSIKYYGLEEEENEKGL